MLFHNQVDHECDGHADAADADKALDELVAFLALQETAEVAADPGAACHDDGDGPVDFSRHAESECAYQQENVGECVLEGVNLDGGESRVSRKSENLYETHTDLHDATVKGDDEKSKRPFESQFFGRIFRRLSENVLVQVAHHDHKADDNSEDCLEKLVADVYQKTGSDNRPDQRGGEQLQKEPHVQVAVTGEVECAAEVPDDKPDAVRAICDGGGEAEEYHDRKAQRGATARDAVDEAYGRA